MLLISTTQQSFLFSEENNIWRCLRVSYMQQRQFSNDRACDQPNLHINAKLDFLYRKKVNRWFMARKDDRNPVRNRIKLYLLYDFNRTCYSNCRKLQSNAVLFFSTVATRVTLHLTTSYIGAYTVHHSSFLSSSSNILTDSLVFVTLWSLWCQ